MEKCTFFPKCILYWAGYRATRPFDDIASSPDLSSASLCEHSVDIGWEKIPAQSSIWIYRYNVNTISAIPH